MARTVVATYCEPQKWSLNWQLHSLFQSVLEHGGPDVELVATIPRGTRHLIDPRIRVRYRQPIGERYRHPGLVATIGLPYYPHVNSFLATAGLRTDAEHILWTDCDTVLTERFSAFEPAGFIVSGHAYATERLRSRLDAFCVRHGYPTTGPADLGATWYGPADQVRRCAEAAIVITRQLLAEEDWSDPAGGNVFLLTMYAAEIAIRCWAPDVRRVAGVLDGDSRGPGTPEQIHVHMWNLTPEFWPQGFGKLGFERGYYDRPDAPPRTGNAALLERFARAGWALAARHRTLQRKPRARIEITGNSILVRDTEIEVDAEVAAMAAQLLTRRDPFRESDAYELAAGVPPALVHQVLDALVDLGALITPEPARTPR